MDIKLTPENILLNLSDRFTERVKGQEVSRINASVGKDLMEELDKYSEHDRGIIFNELKSSKYAPTLYSLKKIAEINSLNKTSSGFIKQYVNLCYCGCYYAQQDKAIDAYCCPMCGELDRTMVEYPGRGGVIVYNKFCVISQVGKVRCGRFKQKMTMRTNGINSDCESYGKGQTLERCKDCQCKECCDYAHDHNNDIIEKDVATLFEEWKRKHKNKLNKC